VVGTFFSDRNVFEKLSRLLLNDLLKQGFVVLRSAVFQNRCLFLDIGKQEPCSFLFPCIKIDGGEQCFKSICQNGLAEPAAVQLLTVTEQQVITQTDVVCKLSAGILTDDGCTHFGQRTFRQGLESRE